MVLGPEVSENVEALTLLSKNRDGCTPMTHKDSMFWLPTDDDILFYEEHGWFVTPKVISDDLINEALAGLQEHWAGHRDEKLPMLTGYADWMPGSGEGTRNNEYLSLQNNRVRKLAWSGVIGAIAARLARTNAVRLFDDQMVCKPASSGNSNIGWHVDGDYWQTCSSQELLTAWVPLQDCPEELGPIAVVDGSHRWSHEVDRSAFSFHLQDMDRLASAIKRAGHSGECKSLPMERGQMSFHHSRTIHGSFPNVGNQMRIALALHMQDSSNQYQSHRHADGRPVQLFNDLICRRDVNGLPDYTDDAVFPTLWSNKPSADHA